MIRWKTHILPGALVVLACGLAGWVLFVQLAADVENLPPAEVLREMEEIRAGLAGSPPLLVVTPAGDIEPNPEARDNASARPGWLKIRAYDAGAGRLVRVELPFWWLKLKQPVFAFALRKAGVDPARLGVTVDDLRRHGAGLVIDDQQEDGDLLVIWTE